MKLILAFLVAVATVVGANPLKSVPIHKPLPPPSPIDRMIQEAELLKANSTSIGSSPGSLYNTGGLFADFTSEFRARSVNDIITVVVADQASATATGSTNTQRKSTAKNGITSIFGQSPTPLSNMLTMTGNNQLQGQGSTGRTNTLTATVSARVTHVLSGGNLVVEGLKQIEVNSEKQWIYVRGVIRPKDLTPANTITSNQVANLELRINGKGVVEDSVRRPNFLYRLLMGIMPF